MPFFVFPAPIPSFGRDVANHPTRLKATAWVYREVPSAPFILPEYWRLQMTQQATIKDLISNNLTIPTIPEIVVRINQMINDPEVGTAEIGALVAEDAPLAAKVLRIANSAFYGLAGNCVSTAQASTVLGIRVLRNIVSQVAVISQFDHIESNEHFNVQKLWDHSIQTAHLSSFIATRASKLKNVAPEEFYVCGLLHDVGKIVLLDGLGTSYLDIVSVAAAKQFPLHVAERAEMQFDHADVGAVVATRWGLPTSVVDAVQYHHGPDDKVAASPVVSIIARANELLHCLEEDNPAAAFGTLDQATRALVGLNDNDVAAILEKGQDVRSIRL
jgi:putative nucleotidyltransferase with HDIG domain